MNINLSIEEIDDMENVEDEYENFETEKELIEKYQQEFINDLYEYSNYFNNYCNNYGLFIGESLIINDFFELIFEEIK